MNRLFAESPLRLPRTSVFLVMRSILLLAVLSGFADQGVIGAADPPADSETDAAARLEFMLDSAEEYEVRLTTEDNRALAPHGEALLRFNNPVSGLRDGVLVMWKDGPRPAVFGQLFQIQDGQWIHEFQSVAQAPLQFLRDGESMWAPRTAAPEFVLMEAAPPAAGRSTRLRQMRMLADRFSAVEDFKISPTEPAGEKSRLRLLPTPLYRYDTDAGELVDGAVFGFVHSTDPELLLVIEARRDGDKTSWHYALAAMTCWGIQAQLDEEDVWSSPERNGTSTPRDLYHVWSYQP